MIIPHYKESIPSYKDQKRVTFEKYERKVKAIVLNINQNSLTKEDKKRLKNKLAKILTDSIKI